MLGLPKASVTLVRSFGSVFFWARFCAGPFFCRARFGWVRFVWAIFIFLWAERLRPRASIADTCRCRLVATASRVMPASLPRPLEPSLRQGLTTSVAGSSGHARTYLPMSMPRRLVEIPT